MSAEKTKKDGDQATEQFDNTMLEPVRAYGTLTTL